MMRQGRFATVSTLALAIIVGIALAGPAGAGEPEPVGPGAGHLMCYKIKDKETKLKGTLADVLTKQLGKSTNCQIKKAQEYCVWAQKDITELGESVNPVDFEPQPWVPSFVCYKIKCDKVTESEQQILDQFGIRNVTLKKPFKLCAPATKGCFNTTRVYVEDCRDLEDPNATVSCDNAWQIGGTGPTSCFDNGGNCRGCGPTNEEGGLCENVCTEGPPCAAGRTYVDSCHDNDSDESACNGAWQMGGIGTTSCYYGLNAYGSGPECYGCGPYNLAAGLCENVCREPSDGYCGPSMPY